MPIVHFELLFLTAYGNFPGINSYHIIAAVQMLSKVRLIFTNKKRGNLG